MLWAKYSQWDQGWCWTLMIDAIWSVLMSQSSAVASSFLGIGTSVKDLSLVQRTKGPDKAICGKTSQRVTLQTLPLLFLKHKAHDFFLLIYGKKWFFFYIFVIISWDLIYCFLWCAHSQFTLHWYQISWLIQWEKLSRHCHWRVFYSRKECAFLVLA